MPQLVLRGLVGKDENVGQLGLDLGIQQLGKTTPTNWETELEQHRQHSARGRAPASAQDGQPVVWITSMVSALPNPLRILSTLE